MERRHYSPNHPAVIAWRRGEALEPHMVHYAERYGTVADRRRAVVARARAQRKPRTYRGQALVGLVLSVGAFVAYDRAEWHDTGEWWAITGVLAGSGLMFLVNAIHHSN